MKFKVGDRVKVIKVNNHFKASHVGRVTTIRAVNPNGDRHTSVHGEHYTIVGGSPFVFYTDELAAMVNKIVITTDGKETLARLYDGDKVLKSATAKCSPDDTFNFETGARMAFDRLFAEEKKEEKPKFEVGKMYKYNGLAVNDNGVIKITGYENRTFTFEIVKGMGNWRILKRFHDNSAMANHMLKEATPEDLKSKSGRR